MKDHDVLFFQGFFFPQIFSDAPSVKRSDWDIFMGPPGASPWSVPGSGFRKNGERKEENMESCSMTWKIS